MPQPLLLCMLQGQTVSSALRNVKSHCLYGHKYIIEVYLLPFFMSNKARPPRSCNQLCRLHRSVYAGAISIVYDGGLVGIIVNKRHCYLDLSSTHTFGLLALSATSIVRQCHLMVTW